VAERLRRYVQVVVNFVGVGSSPTECNTFFSFFWLAPGYSLSKSMVALWLSPTSLQWGAGDTHGFTLGTQHHAADLCQRGGTTKKLSRQSLARPKPTKKGYGGTGIRARVKRITTAYANHYTIPPRLGCEWYS
jgi:hypothetical protein